MQRLGGRIISRQELLKIGLRPDLGDEVDEEDLKKESKDVKEDLEHLAQERVNFDSEIITAQYLQDLAQQPVKNIYTEMNDIKQVVEDKGYINREEEQKVTYLSSAVEMKMNDIKSGKYSFTEEVGLIASVTKQIGAKLRNLYRT